MKKSKNVPEIRFEGFTDSWEQRWLEDMATFGKGRGYTKNDLKNDGVPIILYGRLYTDYKFNISEIDTFAELKDNSVISTGREVIVPSSGETSEDIARGSAVTKSGVILGGDLNILYPSNELLPEYLAILISVGNTKKVLASKAQGKSVVHLHNSDLKELKINVPDIKEQSEIVKLFNSFDNQITFHQNKCNKLLDLKKSILYKLFPKEGENKPEIRFQGFTDEWKKTSISELLQERNLQLPKEKNYPLMAFVAYEGIVDKGERYDRSALIKDSENKKYKRTEFGDFIYSSNNLTTGSIGLNKFGKASVSPVYSVFSTTEKADYKFIGACLTRKEFISKMIRTRQGVVYGQWRIHEKDFLAMEILVPCVQEQRLIGEYLSKLDSIIELYSEKLEKLKHIKSFLLDKMFI